MPLKALTAIEINGAADSLFDHGVFDPKTRRVSVEHAGLNRVEVIDHDAGHHLSTLHGFPETAGVVTDDGQVLVTNRGVAGLRWVDGDTLETLRVHAASPRPNGAAIVPHSRLASDVPDQG